MVVIIINVENSFVINIFVETMTIILGILCWIESSKEQHLIETEIFCNIINVFSHFWTS